MSCSAQIFYFPELVKSPILNSFLLVLYWGGGGDDIFEKVSAVKGERQLIRMGDQCHSQPKSTPHQSPDKKVSKVREEKRKKNPSIINVNNSIKKKK